MANVSPGLPVGNDPNFLGYSRGTYPIQGNMAAGTAIQGIGNIFGEAVQATDTSIKKKIDVSADQNIDALNQQASEGTIGQINGLVHPGSPQQAPTSPAAPGATTTPGTQGTPPTAAPGAPTGTPGANPSTPASFPGAAYGGGAATAPTATPTGAPEQPQPAAPPPGTAASSQINTSLQNLSMMNTGAMQKTMSQSYFNAQLLATTQQLRAQYPGYRDYIDQKISQLTGVVPANALRESLLSNLADWQSHLYTLNHEWIDWKNTNSQYVLPQHPDLFTNPMWDTPQGKAQLMTESGATKARAYQIETQQHALSLSKGTREEQSAQAEQTMTQEFGNLANDTLNGALNSAGMGTMADVQSKMAALAGKPLSPQDLATFDGSLNQMKIKLSQTLRDKANAPFPGGDGKTTYSTYINNESKVNSIIEAQMKQIDVLQDAVHNPQSGMLALAANQIKAAKDNTMYAYRQKYPWVANLEAVKDIVGPNATDSVISGNSGILPDIIQSVKDGDAARSVNDQMAAIGGKAPNNSLAGDTASHASEYGNAQNPKGTLDGPTIKLKVQQAVNMLTNPALPDAARANEIKYVFGNDPQSPGQNFLSQFKSPQDQMTLFKQLTSKPVTDQIKKMKDNGDTQSYQAYAQWVTNNATRLFAPQIADLSQTIKSNSNNLQIGFDDKTNHFNFSLRPDRQGLGGIGVLTSQLSAANQTLSGINSMLDSITPIYEAGGQNTVQELASMLNTIGLNPAVAKGDPKAGANAMLSSMGGAVSKLTSQPNQNFLTPATPSDSSGSLDLNAQQTQASLNGRGMPAAAMAPGASGFRNFIGTAEGAGYNTGFGNHEYPLTTMSINQVLGLQAGLHHTGVESTAMGKNQIMPGTLTGLKESMGLSGNELYDENMQDRMHDQLLQQSGLGNLQQAIKSGNAATIAQAKERFADNLAGVWASLPLANGKSKYEGTGSNHATVDRASVMAAIDRLITQEEKQVSK